MHRWIWIASTLALTSASAAEPPAELMERLSDWAHRTDPENALARVRIRTVSEELDDQGRVLHTDEVVVRVVHRAEDKFPLTELISATRDGKDNRAEAEKKQKEAREKAEKAEKEGKKPARGSLAAALPFGPNQQAKYAFSVLEPYADDPAMVRIGFVPKGERQPELFVGEAKVDPAKGAVVWLTQRPSTMPMMVDTLDMQFHFRGASPQGPVLSEVRLKGKAGLPFMKKRFRAAMYFSELELKAPKP